MDVGKSLQPSERRIQYPGLIHKMIGEISGFLSSRAATLSRDLSGESMKQPLDPADNVREVGVTLSDSEWLAIRLLEDDVLARKLVSQELLQEVAKAQENIRATLHEDTKYILKQSKQIWAIIFYLSGAVNE